jgi:hypothetical protein
VDFDATGLLLIVYFAFVKYLRKNGNTKKQCISYFKKDYDSVGREVLYIILIKFRYPLETGKANNNVYLI